MTEKKRERRMDSLEKRDERERLMQKLAAEMLANEVFMRTHLVHLELWWASMESHLEKAGMSADEVRKYKKSYYESLVFPVKAYLSYFEKEDK